MTINEIFIYFRWLPFMSVRRCARDIADAILKEKVIAFVPGYMTILASVKGYLLNFHLINK